MSFSRFLSRFLLLTGGFIFSLPKAEIVEDLIDMVDTGIENYNDMVAPIIPKIMLPHLSDNLRNTVPKINIESAATIESGTMQTTAKADFFNPEMSDNFLTDRAQAADYAVSGGDTEAAIIPKSWESDLRAGGGPNHPANRQKTGKPARVGMTGRPGFLPEMTGAGARKAGVYRYQQPSSRIAQLAQRRPAIPPSNTGQQHHKPPLSSRLKNDLAQVIASYPLPRHPWEEEQISRESSTEYESHSESSEASSLDSHINSFDVVESMITDLEVDDEEAEDDLDVDGLLLGEQDMNTRHNWSQELSDVDAIDNSADDVEMEMYAGYSGDSPSFLINEAEESDHCDIFSSSHASLQQDLLNGSSARLSMAVADNSLNSLLGFGDNVIGGTGGADVVPMKLSETLAVVETSSSISNPALFSMMCEIYLGGGENSDITLDSVITKSFPISGVSEEEQQANEEKAGILRDIQAQNMELLMQIMDSEHVAQFQQQEAARLAKEFAPQEPAQPLSHEETPVKPPDTSPKKTPFEVIQPILRTTQEDCDPTQEGKYLHRDHFADGRDVIYVLLLRNILLRIIKKSLVVPRYNQILTVLLMGVDSTGKISDGRAVSAKDSDPPKTSKDNPEDNSNRNKSNKSISLAQLPSGQGKTFVAAITAIFLKYWNRVINPDKRVSIAILTSNKMLSWQSYMATEEIFDEFSAIVPTVRLFEEKGGASSDSDEDHAARKNDGSNGTRGGQQHGSGQPTSKKSRTTSKKYGKDGEDEDELPPITDVTYLCPFELARDHGIYYKDQFWSSSFSEASTQSATLDWHKKINVDDPNFEAIIVVDEVDAVLFDGVGETYLTSKNLPFATKFENVAKRIAEFSLELKTKINEIRLESVANAKLDAGGKDSGKGEHFSMMLGRDVSEILESAQMYAMNAKIQAHVSAAKKDFKDELLHEVDSNEAKRRPVEDHETSASARKNSPEISAAEEAKLERLKKDLVQIRGSNYYTVDSFRQYDTIVKLYKYCIGPKVLGKHEVKRIIAQGQGLQGFKEIQAEREEAEANAIGCDSILPGKKPDGKEPPSAVIQAICGEYKMFVHSQVDRWINEGVDLISLVNGVPSLVRNEHYLVDGMGICMWIRKTPSLTTTRAKSLPFFFGKRNEECTEALITALYCGSNGRASNNDEANRQQPAARECVKQWLSEWDEAMEEGADLDSTMTQREQNLKQDQIIRLEKYLEMTGGGVPKSNTGMPRGAQAGGDTRVKDGGRAVILAALQDQRMRDEDSSEYTYDFRDPTTSSSPNAGNAALDKIFRQVSYSEIYYVDHTGSGLVRDRMRFNGFKHLFLEWKHNGGQLLYDPSSETLALSRIRSMEGFHKVIGMTGTLPRMGEPETFDMLEFQLFKEIMKHLYGGGINLPRLNYIPAFAKSRMIEKPRLLENDTEHKWASVIKEGLAEEEKCTLIVTANIKLAYGIAASIGEQINRSKQGYPKAITLFRGTDAEQSLVTQTYGHKDVVITTAAGSRGVDWQCDAINGFEVVATQIPSSKRIQRQIQGRSARCGKPGSFREIVMQSEWLFSQKLQLQFLWKRIAQQILTSFKSDLQTDIVTVLRAHVDENVISEYRKAQEAAKPSYQKKQIVSKVDTGRTKKKEVESKENEEYTKPSQEEEKIRKRLQAKFRLWLTDERNREVGNVASGSLLGEDIAVHLEAFLSGFWEKVLGKDISNQEDRDGLIQIRASIVERLTKEIATRKGLVSYLRKNFYNDYLKANEVLG